MTLIEVVTFAMELGYTPELVYPEPHTMTHWDSYIATGIKFAEIPGNVWDLPSDREASDEEAKELFDLICTHYGKSAALIRWYLR